MRVRCYVFEKINIAKFELLMKKRENLKLSRKESLKSVPARQNTQKKVIVFVGDRMMIEETLEEDLSKFLSMK